MPHRSRPRSGHALLRRAASGAPLLCALGLLWAGAAAAQTSSNGSPNKLLAGIWPDQLLTFDQETMEFEKIGSLRHGAATNFRRTADGRFFLFVTNRMETVEVFDAAEMAVVDEVTLSEGNRRVRFMSATPGPGARRIFLVPVVVEMEADRFLHRSEDQILVFDRERGEVVHRIPTGDLDSWRPSIHFSPDGSRMYFVGDEIVEVDSETYEELDRVRLDAPLAPGYGGVRGHSLSVVEPGRLFGIYRTTEPRQGMALFGVLEIRLPEKTFTHYEVGPAMRLSRFAMSPDGSRGYAGLSDAAVIDMESRQVLVRKKGFERGRTNTSMIVSHDGERVFISGVGDSIWVHDAETLEREAEVFAGGDFMIAPTEITYRADTGN